MTSSCNCRICKGQIKDLYHDSFKLEVMLGDILKLKGTISAKYELIYNFKRHLDYFYREYNKNNWGINEENIREMAFLCEDDIKGFAIRLVLILKNLLSPYQFNEGEYIFVPSSKKKKDPPEAMVKVVVDEISTLLEILSYVEDYDKIHSFIVNLIDIIYFFYKNFKYARGDMEFHYENTKYCVIRFWFHFKRLVENLFKGKYSTDIYTKFEKISEFLQVLKIYAEHLVNELILSQEDDNAISLRDFKELDIIHPTSSFKNRRYIVNSRLNQIYKFFEFYEVKDNTFLFNINIYQSGCHVVNIKHKAEFIPLDEDDIF